MDLFQRNLEIFDNAQKHSKKESDSMVTMFYDFSGPYNKSYLKAAVDECESER